MEYGVHRDLILIYPTPYSIYLRGLYNTQAWGYDNSIAHWRKTVLGYKGGHLSIQDYGIDTEDPPIVPPKYIEHGVEGDLIMIHPKPQSHILSTLGGLYNLNPKS